MLSCARVYVGVCVRVNERCPWLPSLLRFVFLLLPDAGAPAQRRGGPIYRGSPRAARVRTQRAGRSRRHRAELTNEFIQKRCDKITEINRLLRLKIKASQNHCFFFSPQLPVHFCAFAISTQTSGSTGRARGCVTSEIPHADEEHGTRN